MRIALSLSLISCLATPVFAQQSAQDFYKGRQMTLLVGSTPGGGYDTLARAAARNWPRLIPGNPNFVVQTCAQAASR